MFFLLFLIALIWVGSEELTPKVPSRIVSYPIYGVTLDRITNIDRVYDVLKKLPYKPTVRIVFDPGMPPTYYLPAINKLYPIAFIMGEIVDSCVMKKYSVAQYTERTKAYLKLLSPKVDIWEIGNEANGDWLGDSQEVIQKIVAANQLVKAYHGKTALTLHYNENCSAETERKYRMFYWVQHELPASFKGSLDYVWVSYYPENCPDAHPDWNTVFHTLHAIFPTSKLGFGEIGSKDPEKKQALLKEFYSLKIAVPNYVGGYFWWYFSEDVMSTHVLDLQNFVSAFILERNGFKT